MNKDLIKAVKPFNKKMRKASKKLNVYITNMSINIRIAVQDTKDDYFWLPGYVGFGRVEYTYTSATNKKTYKCIYWKLWKGALVQRKEVREP